jgi:lysophospholipase L1-like esterase
MLRRILLIVIALALPLSSGVFLMGTASAAPQNSNSILCGLLRGARVNTSLTVCKPSASTPTSPDRTAQAGNSQIYAALGDSVAAGLGLPSASGASAQDLQCGRSPQAYPYVVAQSLGLKLVHQACSGAMIGDLYTQQHIDGPNPAAQLNAAFAAGTPQLITITAGANDAHWASFIRGCYVGRCDNAASTLAANAFLAAMQVKLYYMFYSIQHRSGSGQPPRVIVTGYYNPLSAACIGGQQQVTADEIAWLTNETSALNQTLRNVTAHFPFATFVPVNFAGHDICSSSPWVQGPGDSAPLHPTANGQQAIAQAVLRALGQ